MKLTLESTELSQKLLIIFKSFKNIMTSKILMMYTFLFVFILQKQYKYKRKFGKKAQELVKLIKRGVLGGLQYENCLY